LSLNVLICDQNIWNISYIAHFLFLAFDFRSFLHVNFTENMWTTTNFASESAPVQSNFCADYFGELTM